MRKPRARSTTAPVVWPTARVCPTTARQSETRGAALPEAGLPSRTTQARPALPTMEREAQARPVRGRELEQTPAGPMTVRAPLVPPMRGLAPGRAAMRREAARQVRPRSEPEPLHPEAARRVRPRRVMWRATELLEKRVNPKCPQPAPAQARRPNLEMEATR